MSTGRLFVFISGLFHATHVGGETFVILSVDISTFLSSFAHMNGDSEELQDLTDNHFEPAGLKIYRTSSIIISRPQVGIICAGDGGELEGQF